MRVHRVLISLMALFLVSSLGDPIRTIEQAYASCCNPIRCGNWPLMLYGDLVLKGNVVTITTVKKQSYSFEITPELQKEAEKITLTHGRGFIVVQGFGDTEPKNLMITTIIPAHRTEHDKKLSLESSMNYYSKLFKGEELKEYRTKK